MCVMVLLQPWKYFENFGYFTNLLYFTVNFTLQKCDY